MKFTPIIGLEIHVELKTESKMFCSCSADHFGKEPNTLTCPVCLGLPGALPVPNKKAIEWTIWAGLSLNCEIPLKSKFDRKNYYYPDLPKGYQISQYDQPLAVDGRWQMADGRFVKIKRVHLEEDTAKLTHEDDKTLINFNRSGVSLVEIVTEPDLESALDAKAFLVNLQKLIRALGISDADMEKGQMRCEPTVNLKIEDQEETFYTPLVELKNINSFKFAHDAIEYEIQRQLEEFEKNRELKKNGNKTTRGWDEDQKKTVLQRSKEEAADYRYFPEPDIPPLEWTEEEVNHWKERINQLERPQTKICRLEEDFGLNESYAKILTENKKMGTYFEKFTKLKSKIDYLKIASLIINKKIDIEKTKPEDLINSLELKAKEAGLSEKELTSIANEVIDGNKKVVEEYLSGKAGVLEYLIGQVMKLSKGRAKPEEVRELLKKYLK